MLKSLKTEMLGGAGFSARRVFFSDVRVPSLDGSSPQALAGVVDAIASKTVAEAT